jgi:zinc transporter ZupT
VGAAVALAVLDRNGYSDNINPTMMGAILNMKNVLAFVAGIMITVAVVELFPEANRHMKVHRLPGIFGTVTGAVVMLASETYLNSQ